MDTTITDCPDSAAPATPASRPGPSELALVEPPRSSKSRPTMPAPRNDLERQMRLRAIEMIRSLGFDALEGMCASYLGLTDLPKTIRKFLRWRDFGDVVNVEVRRQGLVLALCFEHGVQWRQEVELAQRLADKSVRDEAARQQRIRDDTQAARDREGDFMAMVAGSGGVVHRELRVHVEPLASVEETAARRSAFMKALHDSNEYEPFRAWLFARNPVWRTVEAAFRQLSSSASVEQVNAQFLALNLLEIKLGVFRAR